MVSSRYYSMKVLIQNTKSGQYIARHASWTDVAGHAKDFGSSAFAHAIVKAERIPGLRVLFYFEELDYCVQVRKWFGERQRQRLQVTASAH
jgi:hypothetical protein